MANVNVNVANTAINVATTTSNITVSEGNVWVTNVSTTQSNINVSSTISNITVSQIGSVGNAEVRTKISVSNESGYGSLAYDNSPTSNGIIQYTGVSTADIRTTISNASPITYNSITGEIGIDTTELNLETYYDAGSVSGNVSLDIGNGKTQKLTLTSNITKLDINDISAGETITLILTQDVTGNHDIDTVTYYLEWVDWEFVGAVTNLTQTANSETILNIIYDGTTYFGSLVSFDAYDPFVGKTTDDLAEGNVNLYYTTDRANTAITTYLNTDHTVSGNITSLGTLIFTDSSDIPQILKLGDSNPLSIYSESGVRVKIDGDADGSANFEILSHIFDGGAPSQHFVVGDDANVVVNLRPFINYGTGSKFRIKWLGTVDALNTGYEIFSVDVNGNVSIGNVNANENFILPNVRGSNNQILLTDANGIVSWSNISAAISSTDEITEGNVNLYYTTDRANTAIGAYQGDINTAGNITAAYFSGDGGGLSNIPGHLTNAEVMAYISSNDLTVGGNILPSANSVYTLGDANNRWKDLYLSGTSIYLDDTAISAAGGVLSFGGANIAVAGSTAYTTDDLTEGTGNVWFTTDRANTAIETYVSGSGNINFANGIISESLTTTDIDEGDNLYFTTDRANSASDVWLTTKTTSDLTEGSNLYFTTDRANSAIGGYQGDINTAGNITATYFSGDGGGLSNISATANLALNTTDDLAEGNTNLYYTTDRANSASDTWLTTKTTSDLTEGSNLYFTTDRANTAIDDYVVGSENILVNSGVISLANALANVNSVQAESLNKISLGDGVGGFTFTEALGADQTATDVLNMTGGYGYTKAQPSSSFNQLTSTRLITYSGTSDVNALCFTGNVVSGSATIQLTGMEEYRYVANSTTPPLFWTKPIVGTGNIATLINEIVPGMAPMYHTRALGGFYNSFTLGDGGTEGTQTPFPAGTYITSIDTGNLTVTMNNPATSDFEFSSTQANNNLDGNNSFFMNTMRDTDTGFLVGILSEYDVYGGARSRASVGPCKMLSTNVYAYPISGPVAGDFTYTVGSSSDYSLDMSASKFRSYAHYTQGKVSLISSENTYFGIKDGLVIGANTLTTTQMFDNGYSGFGISLGYDGITPYADDFGTITSASSGSQNSFIPRLQIGNFTDLTRQENSLDYGAAELLFRSYNGNLNEPSTGWYARDNQELGKIGWTSYGGGSLPGGELIPSAYISVSAGEDWTDGGFGGKTNMSFVANSRPDTVNAANKFVRDTFLTYEDGGLYLGSNKPSGETRRPVIIGPVAENFMNVQGKGTRGNWTSETKRTWVEMNSANVSVDSGSRLTVTNGGHNGGNAQPVVGDMVIELDRRVGSKARLPDWGWQYVASGTYGQIAEDADTVVIGINYLGNQPLADATPVYFVGTGYGLTQDLVTWTNNSNIGYLKRGRTFTNQVYYGVFEDSGLTTPLTWATVTGTSWVGRGLTTATPLPFPCPLLEYDITPSHTPKKYSFELSETSDTLELKEDDVNIVSFESGNITATGNIQANYIIATTRFDGDINGAIQAEIWNASGGTLNKGDIVALNGNNHGDTPDVVLADSGNASLMPGFGVVKNNIAPNETGEVVISGKLNFSSHGFTIGASLYVNGSGTFTETRPTGEGNLVQKIATVTNSNTINVAGASRSNDIYNVNQGNIIIGDSNNVGVTSKFTDLANTAIGAYTGNFSASNVSLTKFNETVVSLGTLSGDIAANLDVSTGTIFQVTTGGGLTINSLTNAVAGTSATIIITQGATTGTLTSSMKFAGASKTLSTNTGDIDIISVFYDGSTYYSTLSTGYA